MSFKQLRYETRDAAVHIMPEWLLQPLRAQLIVQ